MDAILFDFGGTLDSDGTTWFDRFYVLYKEAGVPADREAFARAFYASDDALAGRHALAAASFEDTVSFQVSDVLSALAPEKAALKERVAARFLSDCRSHFRRNRPILERLARKYRLGIVSNFYGNLDSCLRSEGLRDLFGAVADSGALGVEKPAREIFLHAARTLDARPESCLMVGDSIPRDMRGAETMNMAHALLGASDSSCCLSAWRVAALPELEARL